MTICIKIDVRETLLLNKLENMDKKEIKMVSETLPIGDIIFYDETQNKELIIIERKTISDLVSSIKDGRYEEQSYRLNGIDIPNHHIYYLLEGNVNSFAKDKQMIYSALFSLSYYKGFSVLRTQDCQETAFMIVNMAQKMMKSTGRVPYDSLTSVFEDPVVAEKKYCSVVKKVKKENITPENIGEIMLCQIPGISSQTALAILEKFKTLPSLIEAIRENEQCLQDIYINDSKNKPRKMSKKCIANVLTYLQK